MPRFIACFGVALLLISGSVVAGETVTFRFEAEITELSEWPGVFNVSEKVEIGDRVTGTYTFDPNIQASSGPPDQRWGAMVAWSFTVGGETAAGNGGWYSRDITRSSWYVSFRPVARTTFLDNQYFTGASLNWNPTHPVTDTLPRTPGFRAPGTFILGFTSGAVDAVISGRLLEVTVDRADLNAQGSQTVWRGKPAPEQVPASSEAHQGEKLNAAFWFDNAQEIAILALTDPRSEASLPRLYCGVAGQTGSMLWQATSTPSGAEKQWQLTRADLLPVSATCATAITTVASLRRAAEERLLYVEYERGGVTQRAQLWPKALMADRIHVASAIATVDQVVEPTSADNGGNKLVTRLRLNEQDRVLDGLDYYIDAANGPTPLARATLHCAPPGVTGPIVAELSVTGNASWSPLAATELMTTSAAGPCGLEINTIAALVEAYLRGNLYIRLEGADGTVWRGQVLGP